MVFGQGQMNIRRLAIILSAKSIVGGDGILVDIVLTQKVA